MFAVCALFVPSFNVLCLLVCVFVFRAPGFAFRHRFHRPIHRVSFPPGLRRLTFGWRFNFPITEVVWPSSLQRLMFGSLFNQVRGLRLGLVAPLWGGTPRKYQEMQANTTARVHHHLPFVGDSVHGMAIHITVGPALLVGDFRRFLVPSPDCALKNSPDLAAAFLRRVVAKSPKRE